MKYITIIALTTFVSFHTIAQPNCNQFEKNSNCYQACKDAIQADEHYVGGREFQRHLLKSIELCPDFAYAYWKLSIPYAKRGLIPEWNKLINKAVEKSPEEHLGWRGWYHWFFMRNYEKAIEDIERLSNLVPGDIGTTGDGTYHLNVIRALSYKKLGKLDTAIAIIQQTMTSQYYIEGIYDHLHLAVLHIEQGNYDYAINKLEKQKAYNDISEAYYYSALVYLKKNQYQQAKEDINIALQKFEEGKKMQDPYIELEDQIYRQDIVQLLGTIEL